jgi:hypothetical protein
MSAVSGGALANVLTTNDVATTASTASGGTSSSHSSGGSSGGGGGSAAISDREQYYRIYKAVAQVLGIPMNAKIAAMAFKNRQPGSGFLSLVKKFDKNYLKTDDFKKNAASFVKKWNEYFPYQKVDFNDMKRFVRGDWNADRMDLFMQSTAAFKKAYPYFRAGIDDPSTYAAHERGLTNSLAAAGLGQLTDRRKELFHKLNMTPTEVDQRIEELVTGHDATDLMYGAQRPTGTQAGVNDYIFNTPGSMVRRQVLQEALKGQQGLNQSKISGSTIKRDSRTDKLQVSI